MSRFAILGMVSLLVGVALAYPSTLDTKNLTIFKDPSSGLKYFWHPDEKGGFQQAFIEGGPAPVVQATEDDVHFFLFTKSHPTPWELKPDCPDCIANSGFDRNAPVKFVCHGFTADYQSSMDVLLRNAFIGRSEFFNIIHVNWEALAAAPWYDTAAANTIPVGQYVTRFVNWLVSNGYTTHSRIHYSGHSLGAHVGSHLGNLGTKIARITAMDPALPLFGERPDSERIDPTDATFVDVIHTAGGGLAFLEARGDVDFYPNGGAPYQPGCGIDVISTCSHSRAYEFFAESIWHTNGFPGYKCNSWEEYDSGRCSMTDRAFMGEPCSPSARGKYYLRTNQNPPFGQE
ncbi:pancreatic lipase-related protein 2 [Folsomia candida]|uniref:Pancreatic lipase-related protein 2 n=1 Tax=Folsomia candida TaxID=158441 RepID=A0A226ELS3_FOLCA|nr:pancreatic lipase-related protein 2 [Folsomia candida]OXA57954.1 Pancreatic lipase-related protein 2 [Folsomia candida]